MAEIRRSLRTASAREARRRALDVQVRVEDVDLVLRSERPLRPARDVAMALLEQGLATSDGTPGSREVRGQTLRDARGAMRRTGGRDVSVGRYGDAVGLGEIRIDDVVTAAEALCLLPPEGPRGGRKQYRGFDPRSGRRNRSSKSSSGIKAKPGTTRPSTGIVPSPRCRAPLPAPITRATSSTTNSPAISEISRICRSRTVKAHAIRTRVAACRTPLTFGPETKTRNIDRPRMYLLG